MTTKPVLVSRMKKFFGDTILAISDKIIQNGHFE